MTESSGEFRVVDAEGAKPVVRLPVRWDPT